MSSSSLEISRTQTILPDVPSTEAALRPAANAEDLVFSRTATLCEQGDGSKLASDKDALENEEPTTPLTPPSLSGQQTATDTKRGSLASTKVDSRPDATAVPVFSTAHKWGLLAMFSLSLFIDIWCYAAFLIFTAPIAEDLDVSFTQQSWIITAYAATFAAFLLFWGRVSDLYSAKPVFSWGFLTLGLISLITSFLPEKMSFFIFRALAGIAGATLIPASFRLIAYVFTDEAERARAFTIFTMSGTIANVTGTLVAGVVQLITAGGQMIAWRWFFRILAIIIVPVALLAFVYVPNAPGEAATINEPKWKRLDLVGAFTMLAAIILLILGLTLGASYGWKKAGFLVPFLLSFVLFPFFFFWESRLDDDHALLPARVWREIPNFAILIPFALQIYPWWGVNFLAFVEVFTKIHGEKDILAAVRVLPEGVVAFAASILLTAVPVLVRRPRYPIIIGMLFGMVGYVLFTQTDNFVGKDYWRFIFPGMIIGSAGMLAVFVGTSVAVMTSVPPQMAGVAGAVLQVALQVGAAVGFSIQAGLMTVSPGGLSNPGNIHASFYFQLGWVVLWLIGFVVFYREPKGSPNDEETKIVPAH